MNKLSTQEQVQILRCLVDGVSLRATTRITGFHRTTVMKFLALVGAACSEFQDRTLVGLNCKRLQCDEIWSFVYCKDKNLPPHLKDKPGVGSVWTWIAMDAQTKLIPCWFLGSRDASAAYHFMHDLKKRLAHRVQLTTDGHRPYLDAVSHAFGSDIDFAMLQKIYGAETAPENTRYSPAKCMGTRTTVITGKPDAGHVSTSHVERTNLTLRMNNRRFTRLTNAFSKKLENHEHHLALHFMYYNFARIHQSLRATPAMAAGIADHVWELEEIVHLIDSAPDKRSP